MGFCKTFCSKRTGRRDSDVLADVGVGAIRRERLQGWKYRVSANVVTHVKLL
jgi:hypothetical protein